jgi:hypothetical protein
MVRLVNAKRYLRSVSKQPTTFYGLCPPPISFFSVSCSYHSLRLALELEREEANQREQSQAPPTVPINDINLEEDNAVDMGQFILQSSPRKASRQLLSPGDWIGYEDKASRAYRNVKPLVAHLFVCLITDISNI